MKTRFRVHRWRVLRLVGQISLHQFLLWALAGHDVTAVFLSPNENSPVHWTLLAALLILLRLTLLIFIPGWLFWKFTQPIRTRRHRLWEASIPPPA
jgi:hypothetical protein